MKSALRTFTLSAAIAVAIVTLAPAAQARHHHRAHAAAKVVLIPAHQRPDWVGLAGVPVPGVIDVGLGPVFPFAGWPAKL